MVCGRMGIAGTIRGDLALDSARNTLHCSDLEETENEMMLFIADEDIFDYNMHIEDWLT